MPWAWITNRGRSSRFMGTPWEEGEGREAGLPEPTRHVCSLAREAPRHLDPEPEIYR